MEGLDINFQRNLFMETKFKYYGLTSQRMRNETKSSRAGMDKQQNKDALLYLPFIRDVEVPILEQEGEMSKNVRFIL